MEEDDKSSVVEAHQELVYHIERGMARIRALSLLTMAVAAVLAVSYAFQLALPLEGVSTVTVDLASPANEAAELAVLFLSLVWLYVGISNALFVRRVGPRIAEARSREAELEKRALGEPAQSV